MIRYRSRAGTLIAVVLMGICATVFLLCAGCSAGETTQSDPETVRAEETVKAYYESVLLGDYEAAIARMDIPHEQARAIISVYDAPNAALDTHQLSGSSAEGDIVTVLVDEVFVNDEGKTLDREVTYTLTSTDGEMMIISVSATGFDPIATAEAPVVYPRDAEAAVDVFLGLIAVDDSESAMALATDRFASENPQYFDGSLGKLSEWDILGSEQLTSMRLRVRVREEWAAGSVTVDYQIVVEDDGLLVDTVTPVK